MCDSPTFSFYMLFHSAICNSPFSKRLVISLKCEYRKAKSRDFKGLPFQVLRVYYYLKTAEQIVSFQSINIYMLQLKCNIVLLLHVDVRTTTAFEVLI